MVRQASIEIQPSWLYNNGIIVQYPGATGGGVRMREMTKQKITTYAMKLRLYPSPEQKAAIDNILRALHIAFNITFHQVFLKNPAICTAPKENGAVWPDWKKIAGKEWRAFLIAENPAVDYAPAASLTTNNGLFLSDSKKAWEKPWGKSPLTQAKEKNSTSTAQPSPGTVSSFRSRPKT